MCKTWREKRGKCVKHGYGRVIKCVKHGERGEVNVLNIDTEES